MQLEEAGHGVVVQAWDLAQQPYRRDGKAIQSTDRLLPILSEAYLKSRCGRLEWFWQPGQDYRAADAIHAARHQPTRTRHGSERIGPER
jgi:hypothetical protein